jgi:hypothetical protein
MRYSVSLRQCVFSETHLTRGDCWAVVLVPDRRTYPSANHNKPLSIHPIAPRNPRITRLMSAKPLQPGSTPARNVLMPSIINPIPSRRRVAWKRIPGLLKSQLSASLRGKIADVAWPTNASAAPTKASKKPVVPTTPYLRLLACRACMPTRPINTPRYARLIAAVPR